MNAKGQSEVFLQGFALFAVQMVDAEPQQGIGGQALRLDRIMTGFAQPVTAVLEPLQCEVHVIQQSHQPRWPSHRYQR